MLLSQTLSPIFATLDLAISSVKVLHHSFGLNTYLDH